MSYWNSQTRYSSDQLFRNVAYRFNEIKKDIAEFKSVDKLTPSSKAYVEAISEFINYMAPEADVCLNHERMVNDVELNYDQANKWPKELHQITPANGLPSISIFTPGVSSSRLTQDNLHSYFPGDPAIICKTPYVVVGNFSKAYKQVELRGFSKNRDYDWSYTVKMDDNGKRVTNTYWEQNYLQKFQDGVTPQVANMLVDCISVYIGTGMGESGSVKSQDVVKEGLIKLYGG